MTHWLEDLPMLTRARAWLSDIEKRPVSRRNRLGALLAVLTCPCHLGVAVVLLSGTAVGGWLAAQKAWLYLVFTAAFVTGLVVLFRRDPNDCDSCRP
jgi:cytochrome c biogenesis protein CcdA